MSPENTQRPQVSERLMLIPAILKNSTTGYKNVSYKRREQKFEAKVNDGGKRVSLGHFDTAEEAAVAYARSEYGRADAAKLLQPRAAPSAAGAEAIRQAEREGLTLAASSSGSSGYKGVSYCPKQSGTKKYELRVKIGGKDVHLGRFATAEQAALFYARREAGRDTSDLTAPPPPPPPPAAAGAKAVQQAGLEGLTLATSRSSNSGYKGVQFKPKQQSSNTYEQQVSVGSVEGDSCDPADIAAAVALAALRPALRERAEGGEAAGARSRTGEGGGCSGGGGAGGGVCCPAMG